MSVLVLILQSILQGIVQGITEWLPISSTGHILLLDAVWPMDVREEFFNVFKVVIQLGSILAVVVLYFRRLNPFSRRKSAAQRRDTWRLWAKVVVASVPVGVLGLLLNDLVDEQLSTPLVIAIALAVYGVAFLWMETHPRKAPVKSVKELSFAKALGIGAFQALSIIPGTSRSGSTILGGTLLGTSRTVAAEFSFFMAIPAMLGASGVKVLKFLKTGLHFSASEWIALVIGTAVAFIVSVFAIRFLMNYIKKHDFKVFGWYRLALAAIILIALACGLFR